MIKEYGKENFTIEEIDSAKTFEELDSKEKYWIKELNTIFPKGYNEEPHRKDSLKRIKLDFKASDELVNIGKLSKILNVSPQTIRNWESKGLIKSYRTLKNHRRYKLSEVYSNFKQE